MKKVIKIFFINISFFTFLIVCIDLTFGYWFDDYNFGPNMRGKRVQKIIFNKDNKKTFYYRDFFGFREDGNINKKYDASKIKVIFNGGSTGDEMFLNYKETIVGKINSNLKNDKIDFKIFNASLSGKSLKGHVNEFSYWFAKIPNFKPDIIVYYFGINDRNLNKSRWHDYETNYNFYNIIIDNISQKSFFWEKIKIIKDKYFYTQENLGKYFTNDKDLLKKLKEKKFISHKEASKKYKFKDKTENKIIENFNKNLKNLKKNLDEWDIKPIFITQITYDINGDKLLYFLNLELKKFANKNEYDIIKLDELIKEPLINSFVDQVHTNSNGSEKIANILYPKLKDKILELSKK
tara:strand:- start:121 stop:1170 length:1050 start_codon:yes stop_codon:yes gene_type:complete